MLCFSDKHDLTALTTTTSCHCVKGFRIQSYSGLYSVRMRENTDQNNSEYEHFSPSEQFL